MNENRKSRQGKKRILKTRFIRPDDRDGRRNRVHVQGLFRYRRYCGIDLQRSECCRDARKSIEVETATQPISFVLLGVDTGTAEEERTETGRSDTIIVCTVNPNTHTTTLLSIPRDTYSEIMGPSNLYDYYGDYYDKMNYCLCFRRHRNVHQYGSGIPEYTDRLLC